MRSIEIILIRNLISILTVVVLELLIVGRSKEKVRYYFKRIFIWEVMAVVVLNTIVSEFD